MRVGINALHMTAKVGFRRTGVGRYINRLVAALPAELEGELVVYANRTAKGDTAWRRSWMPLDHPAARTMWEHLAIPAMARRDGLDLYHGTVNVIPMGLPCPAVVTIHDLAFLRFPEQVPVRRQRYLSRAVREAATRSDQVITVSEATKRDIVELLGADADRVHVTPLGVEPAFHPWDAEALDAFRQSHAVERPYLLSVGTLEPRKNIPGLIAAYREVAASVPHDLVLVGAEGWLTEGIHATIQAAGLGNRIKLTGFVPDGDLPGWYGAADAFVFPSLYEGFGLPVLEAMACGTPVVTADNSSLAEVAGDAALLVDASDTAGLAGALLRIVDDESLRTDLRARGLARSATYAWQRTAAQTAAVYRKALE